MTGEVCSGTVQSNLRLQAFLILGRAWQFQKGRGVQAQLDLCGATPQMAEIHRQNSSAAATTTPRRDLGTCKPKLMLKIPRPWSFGGLGPFWSWSSLCILPFTTYKEGTRDGVNTIKRPSSSQVHSPSSGMELRAQLSPSRGTQQHVALQDTLKSNAQEKWGCAWVAPSTHEPREDWVKQ